MVVFALLSGTIYAAPKVGPITPENAIIGQYDYDTIGSGGVFALPSGNIVIASPSWNETRGAVTCLTPAEYKAGGIVVSAANSLVGSSYGDVVGNYGITILTNGNYVVRSSDWDNGAKIDVGAVTWVNGTTCIPYGADSPGAIVGPSNSLIGTAASHAVGSGGITALTNGNYVVNTPQWYNGAIGNVGAVTWGNGATGIVGVVSATNSLVGAVIGHHIGFHGVTALSNGHYVVSSGFWDNGAATNAGAVTWGNGITGTVGVVNTSNSLVGSMVNDRVGIGGIVALPNGNYIVRSSDWNSEAATMAGAITWGDGSGGTVGVVSASNSLVGSTSEDQIGNQGITVLTNSNYVVRSPYWDNGVITDAGAVTWGNGLGGTAGTVSASNSLVGSTAYDKVGDLTPIVLANGNYVVRFPGWDNGVIADVGAVTWGNGATGTVGVVSPANSLVGSTFRDGVGTNVLALTNGNYIVASPGWDNGAIVNVGAITWANGTTGKVGTVSTSNSLVGSSADNRVGSSSITALTNGNYVVTSPTYGTITSAGAVTWGNGTTGTVGVVSPANSLVGSTANDHVGKDGVVALMNGNYVVSSRAWDNGVIDDVGAVTWGNGTTGTVGVVSPANSLVGSTPYDRVGGDGSVALMNGNYVVPSPDWDNSTVGNVGAVTWGNGATGTVGAVSRTNSWVGATANDSIGYDGVEALSNGNYVIRSSKWDNGAVVDAGAVTLGNGLGGTVGTVSATNSLHSAANQGIFVSSTARFVELSDSSYLLNFAIWDYGATQNSWIGMVVWSDGTSPNTDPVLAEIGDQTVDEGDTLIFDVEATDTDVPAQTLTFSVTGQPEGATFDTATGEFSWTPTEADGGEVFNVTVTVTDNGVPAGSDSEVFTLTVNEINTDPVLAEIGDQTVDEGDTLIFDVEATDTDIPAQTLTFSVTGQPEGATFDTATGEFSWTPTEADGGEVFNVTVTVTDDDEPAGSDSEAFTITVNEVDESDNQAPVLAAIGDRYGYVGKPLSIVVSATDSDIPAQTLTFSLEAGAPDGATIDTVSGLFSWPIDASVTPGDYPVTIAVTDDDASPLSDSETITITVAQDNFINNYGFENPGTTNKTAAGWKAFKTAKTDQRVCNTAQKTVAYEGLCAYRFQLTGQAEPARAIQRKTSSTDFVKGDVLELRGMVKANNLKIGARLILKAVYANKKQTVTYAGVPTGTYDYQPLSTQITLSRVPVKIVVQVKGGKAKGTFFVDDMAVVVPLQPGGSELPPEPPDASEMRGTN